MWSELPSCSMLLLFALGLFLQRFTEGSPVGNREEIVIQVCGERFRPTMRLFCKGIYNNNFATSQTGVNTEISESNWESIFDTTSEMKEDIVDKCCRKGCTQSDLRKYCGAGLLDRPMLDTPGVPNQLSSGINKSSDLHNGDPPKKPGQIQNSKSGPRENSTRPSTSPKKSARDRSKQCRRLEKNRRGKHRKSPGGFPRYVPVVVGYIDIKGNGGVEIGRSPRNVFPPQFATPPGNFLSNRINPSIWKPIKNPRSIFSQRPINSDETMDNDRAMGLIGSGPGYGQGTRGFMSPPGGNSRWAAAVRESRGRVTEGPVPGSYVVPGMGNEYSYAP